MIYFFVLSVTLRYLTHVNNLKLNHFLSGNSDRDLNFFRIVVGVWIAIQLWIGDPYRQFTISSTLPMKRGRKSDFDIFRYKFNFSIIHLHIHLSQRRNFTHGRTRPKVHLRWTTFTEPSFTFFYLLLNKKV